MVVRGGLEGREELFLELNPMAEVLELELGVGPKDGEVVVLMER